MDPLRFLRYLDPDDQQLATEFFAAFAGAEYTLKERGYIKRGRDDGAGADWDAYAQAISGLFKKQRDPEFRAAWADLTTSPPRKQVVRNGHLAWQSTSRGPKWTDEYWGLLLARRVRNNLFHGGKFILGGFDGYARDRSLVQAALLITRRALSEPPIRGRSRSSGRAA